MARLKCRTPSSVGKTSVAFSVCRVALSAAIASACSRALVSSLLSFLKPRSSSSSGVRERTTSGCSSVPASAAWARSDTRSVSVSPVSSPRRPDGKRAPLVVVEVRPCRGRVEVLQGAAARLGAYELDAVVVAQHADVVGDDSEWSAELRGEVTRARDTLPEALQDACAQRMGERFGDPQLRRHVGREVGVVIAHVR